MPMNVEIKNTTVCIKLHAPTVSVYGSCRCLCVSLFTASCNTRSLDPGLLARQLLPFTYLWLFCLLPQVSVWAGTAQSVQWPGYGLDVWRVGVRQTLGANILQNVKAVLEFGSIPFQIPVVWPTLMSKFLVVSDSHTLNAGTWPCNMQKQLTVVGCSRLWHW